MYKKYDKQGLVLITVSVDDPTDEESVAEVKKFLQQQKAVCTNYLLDEEPEVWQNALKVIGVPCVLVYNAEGKLEKKYTEEPKKEEIEKLVEQLLKQKP